MLRKYALFICFCFWATTLWAQLSCPDFKIRGNKSPRSNRFTTAIKFQFDGIVQYQGISSRYSKETGLNPALSLGLEQSLSRRISISAIHGWTFNPKNYNSRFIVGDFRYYFDECFENRWFSTRITWAEGYQASESLTMQPFASLHYGKTARRKRIFTHYETGIGFGKREVIVLMFGAATGFKL